MAESLVSSFIIRKQTPCFIDLVQIKLLKLYICGGLNGIEGAHVLTLSPGSFIYNYMTSQVRVLTHDWCLFGWLLPLALLLSCSVLLLLLLLFPNVPAVQYWHYGRVGGWMSYRDEQVGWLRWVAMAWCGDRTRIEKSWKSLCAMTVNAPYIQSHLTGRTFFFLF